MKEEYLLINELVQAEDILEAFNFYYKNIESVKDFEIILSRKKSINTMPIPLKTKNIDDKAYLRNFFKYSGIFFLDEKTVIEMMKGEKVNINYDYSVSLDSNMISYLDRSVKRKFSKVPDEFLDAIIYLIKEDINFDALEYLMENYKAAKEKRKEIKENLISYQILKNIDEEALFNYRLIIPNISMKEIIEKTEEEYQSWLKILENKEFKIIIKLYNLCYLLLLKMCQIQLQHKNKSLENKLEMFLEFMQEDLGVLCVKELLIANLYFQKGNNMSFFRKIQKGSKKILVDLKNMSWDLFHIRRIEQNRLFFNDNSYYIPLFFTFDKGLMELIDITKLSALVYNKKDKSITPFYNDIIEQENFKITPKLEKYFTKTKRAERKPYKEFEKLIDDLEKYFITNNG